MQRPTLLFLHGTGDGDPTDAWRAVLDEALARVGYPGLSEIEVVAPKYAYGLRGIDDDDVSLPKVTVRALRGEAAARNRREYERRRTAMEVLLGADERGSALPADDQIVPFVARRRPFVQAKNYVENRKIRAWVLQRILDQVGTPEELVIVGHSLGSVIAADILRRLPPDVYVVGMVTIGSPLAHKVFHLDRLRESLSEPPTNLAWWANFWNTGDPVSAHRGVSTAIPWVLDQRIVEHNPRGAHDAATYLTTERVATAIGYSLFGSRSTGLAVIEKGVDIPLDLSETMTLLALRYAHLTMAQLEGETRDRYADAIRHVQGDTFALIKDRNLSQNRAIPSPIAALAIDLTDPNSGEVEPAAPGHWSIEEAIVPLIAIATMNLIRPFEIEVPKAKRRAAIEQLALEMGFGRRVGTNVFSAIDEAGKALKGSTNWLKWTALGLGAGAMIAATGGLALAAAPGVVGAAAITSALAAFGPGGMIGGLLTAGTLMTAGGGGIAVGLASPATTAAAVEAVVATQLASAILRDLQGLQQDPQVWQNLTDLETAVTRELAHLEAVSDESAPSLEELRRKRDAIRRALDHLEDNGLGPQQLSLVDDTDRAESSGNSSTPGTPPS